MQEVDTSKYEFTFDACKGCQKEKELKLPEKLCGTCWSKKKRMRKKQAEKIKKFYQRGKGQASETPTQGQNTCAACGAAVPLYNINPSTGNCGSCQAQLNWKMNKEEDRYERTKIKRK